MKPAQNRALRSVLLSHLRHLDRFVMYLETAPGIDLKDSIFEGMRTDTSYQRATIRAAIHQLEDTHEHQSKTSPTGRGAGIPESTRSSPDRNQ